MSCPLNSSKADGGNEQYNPGTIKQADLFMTSSGHLPEEEKTASPTEAQTMTMKKIRDQALKNVNGRSKLKNVCSFECLICRKPYHYLGAVQAHIKQKHGESPTSKYKMTRTTFLQCQICCCFVYCDSLILRSHLKEHHKEKVKKYYQSYPDFLTGERNELLAEHNKHRGMYTMISHEWSLQAVQQNGIAERDTTTINDPIEKAGYKSVNSVFLPEEEVTARRKRHQVLVKSDCKSKLKNVCSFQCLKCKRTYDSFGSLTRHIRTVHKERASRLNCQLTKTTFIQCQICRHFFYCTPSLLSDHLAHNHNEKVGKYYQSYPNFLTGERNDWLAEQMKHKGLYATISPDREIGDTVIVNSNDMCDIEVDEWKNNIKMEEDPLLTDITDKEEGCVDEKKANQINYAFDSSGDMKPNTATGTQQLDSFNEGSNSENPGPVIHVSRNWSTDIIYKGDSCMDKKRAKNEADTFDSNELVKIEEDNSLSDIADKEESCVDEKKAKHEKDDFESSGIVKQNTMSGMQQFTLLEDESASKNSGIVAQVSRNSSATIKSEYFDLL